MEETLTFAYCCQEGLAGEGSGYNLPAELLKAKAAQAGQAFDRPSRMSRVGAGWRYVTSGWYDVFLAGGSDFV